MPTAIGGRPSVRCGMPRRQRISIAVTMRPRRLSTPAISGDDSGTRVSRSGMNTSCTREIGSPNSWLPISTVTYSVTCSLKAALVMVMFFASGGLTQFNARVLECCDQPLAVELGDEIVEPGLATALDGRRRGDRRQRDDRDLCAARIGAELLGEIKPVHA